MKDYADLWKKFYEYKLKHSFSSFYKRELKLFLKINNTKFDNLHRAGFIIQLSKEEYKFTGFTNNIRNRFKFEDCIK